MTAAPAHALGFGRIVNATQLGQPLNFSASVRVEADEELPRECVAAEVQSGDNKLPAGTVRVTLEDDRSDRTGADVTDRRVRVTTSGLIDEPVVTVSVTLGCTARITRRFVVFIDPPLINAPLAGSELPPSLPPQRIDSAVAPIVRLVDSDRLESRRAVAEPAPRFAGTARAAASPASATTATGRMAARAVARPPAQAAVRPRPAPSASTQIAATASPARPASVPPTPPTRSATTRGLASAQPVPAAGPRLKLEAAAPVTPALAAAASSPSAAIEPGAVAQARVSSERASSERASSESASGEKATIEDIVQHDRMRALEDGLATLRADAAATQQSVAALQARLHQAETERYANPLVYGLAWLSALLALAVAALWWRQSRNRPASPWWTGPGPSPSRLAESVAGTGSEAEPSDPARPWVAAAALQPVTAADAFSLRAGPIAQSTGESIDEATDDTTTPTVPTANAAWVAATAATAAAADTGTAPASARAPGGVTRAEPVSGPVADAARESSVEELIDLEQQAEFFIVLGQDDAAIDLLMSHVRSDGGISPLPYLKLLEIYRRRGEREAYERIRERFNRRFNAYAADWDADLQQGRSLVDYPAIVTRLQSLWVMPTRVMETLDASLFRRHRSDETFDLPAYRELLFLYAIARDLAEHGTAAPAAEVDLLLPIDSDDHAPIARLSATGPGALNESGEFQNSEMLTLPLDLDVSLGPPSGSGRRPSVQASSHEPPGSQETADTAPAALRRTAAAPPVLNDSAMVDLDLGAPLQPLRPGHLRRR